MEMTLPLWQTISLAVTLLGAFAGLVKLLLRQVELRIDERLAQIGQESKGWRQVERDVMALRAELPERYVRREDYIRGQTVIEAKLDAINAEVKMVQLRGAKGG
nr:hypothetical protein [Immundisolibacter sp.]